MSINDFCFAGDPSVQTAFIAWAISSKGAIVNSNEAHVVNHCWPANPPPVSPIEIHGEKKGFIAAIRSSGSQKFNTHFRVEVEGSEKPVLIGAGDTRTERVVFGCLAFTLALAGIDFDSFASRQESKNRSCSKIWASESVANFFGIDSVPNTCSNEAVLMSERVMKSTLSKPRSNLRLLVHF